MSFFRNVFHYSSFTLISRVTGQVRTTLMAALWGTSAYGDIFFLAFKIPNLLRRFFAEGAMSSAFIPLFSKMSREKDLSPRSAGGFSKEEFYFTIFWLLTAVMVVVVLSGIAFSGAIASFLFILQNQAEFSKVEETSLLLKILFPYIGFISLCSLQQGVLENHGKFSISASVPVLFNLIVITSVSVVLLLDRDGEGLLMREILGQGFFQRYRGGGKELTQTVLVSLGVILGGAGQLGYAFWGARRLGYRIWPFSGKGFLSRRTMKEYYSHPSVKKFLFLLLPVFLSSGSYQIQILLTEPIALSLGEGAISVLYYANRLLEFPLGIVGVAVTTASLPLLSRAVHHTEKEEFLRLLQTTLNALYILFLPILLVSVFYPETIISIVFEFNRFTREDTADTALCFLVLIPSLFSLSGYRIIFNAFYAREDTRTPLLISSISLFFGVPLAFLLTRLHPHPVMIALSATMSSYLMWGVSLYLLERKLGLSLAAHLWERSRFFLGVAVWVVPMVYLISRLMDPIFQVWEKAAGDLWLTKLVYIGKLGFFSLWVFGIYFGILILFREPQVMRFLSSFLTGKGKD